MPVTTLHRKALFNTASLRKAVALSALNDYAEDIKVKNVTYDGDTYPEGAITLDVKTGDALDLDRIHSFERLIRNVWHDSFVQVGMRNKKIVLFIYEQRAI